MTVKKIGPYLFLYALSVGVRFALADYSDWGVDEAANLWLGSRILAGDAELLGLVSSKGIRNLAGAPLMGIPFTILPDLLSISRALSMVNLAAVGLLGFYLSRLSDRRAFATCLLIFFPSLIFASFSLWNQYLILPISAMNLVLLLFLLEGRGGALLRSLAASVVAALALLEAAVHLIGFSDLAVHLFLLSVVMALRPHPFRASIAAGFLIVVGAAAAFIYIPWIPDTFLRLGKRWHIMFFFPAGLYSVAGSVMVIARGRGLQNVLHRILAWSGRSRALSWFVLAVLLIGIMACAVPSFLGAQPGRRLFEAKDPFGLFLLAVQVVLALSLLVALFPVVRQCIRRVPCRDVITESFPNCSGSGTLLIAHAGLLLAGRLLFAKNMLAPYGRSDLLVSLIPALLAPLILLVEETAQPRLKWSCTAAASLAVPILFCFALRGPSQAYRSYHPRFVPPSEMREAVDWVAVHHKRNGGSRVIDLGYTLDHGREWIPKKVTRFPGFRWYSIGRPYDWLLLRRHGLVNVHEGAVDRRGGGGYQLAYRCESSPSPVMRVVHRLEKLEILERR